MIITRGSTLGRGCGIVWGVGGARRQAEEGHSIETERDL